MFKNRWRKKLIKEIEQLPKFTYPDCCAVTQKVIERSVIQIIKEKEGKK